MKDQDCKFCDQPHQPEHHPMMVRMPLTREANNAFRDLHPCSWLPPISNDETLLKRVEQDSVSTIGVCQRHSHTATCYKYYDQLRKKYPGLKKVCRFHFAKELEFFS